MAYQNVAVITGATAGLGQFVALGLARAGLHTVLIARNGQRGEATRRFISQHAPHASTELVLADLSSLAETRQAALTIALRHRQVAVLVNNAGLITPRRQVTAEGHERMLAVNHLSPFVLTSALEPSLRAAAPSRVVGVGMVRLGRLRLDIDDMEGARSFSPLRAYHRSKLAMFLSSYERARRLAGSGVAVNVVNPGLIATRFGALRGPIGWCWAGLRPFMVSPERGSDAPLFVALSPSLADITSVYFTRRKPARPNLQAMNARLAGRVWAETERLIGR